MAIDGQPLVIPLMVVFVVALAMSAALAWVALRTRRHPGAMSPHAPLLKKRAIS
jgi:membrane protease YdiL (CAAX protease family)